MKEEIRMHKKMLLLIPLLVLASCGAQANNIVPSSIDRSGNWDDNYYTYFDTSLKNKEVEEIVLEKEKNKVFTTFTDQNFIAQEEMGKDISNYYNDFMDDGFGQIMKLSKQNEAVKEGFVSKLFDGQLFCHQYYELSRVQINEEGFSSSFHKELESASYLYLNFKSAVDFKKYRPAAHLASFKIHITLYGEKNYRYTYLIDEVPTNAGETYVFYGFSLEGMDLKGVRDFSISYTLVDEPAKKVDPNVGHALLLYEFGFKNPSFK